MWLCRSKRSDFSRLAEPTSDSSTSAVSSTTGARAWDAGSCCMPQAQNWSVILKACVEKDEEKAKKPAQQLAKVTAMHKKRPHSDGKQHTSRRLCNFRFLALEGLR